MPNTPETDALRRERDLLTQEIEHRVALEEALAEKKRAAALAQSAQDMVDEVAGKLDTAHTPAARHRKLLDQVAQEQLEAAAQRFGPALADRLQTFDAALDEHLTRGVEASATLFAAREARVRELDEDLQRSDERMAALIDDRLTDVARSFGAIADRFGRRMGRNWWLRPAVVVLLLLAIHFVAEWGLAMWSAADIQSRRDLRAALDGDLAEQRETLQHITDETGGLVFHHADDGGRYLLLPPATTVVDGWTIGGRAAVRLVMD